MKNTETIAVKVGLAGLYVFVLSMPFSPALSEAGFEISLLAAIVVAAVNRHLRLPTRVYTLALVLFIVLAGVTLPFSMDPSLSIRKFFIVRWLLFPFVLTGLSPDAQTSKRLFNLLLLVSGIFALFLIAQHLLGRPLLPYKFGIYQTVNYANHNLSDRIALRFGQYYAVLFVIVVVLVWLRKEAAFRIAGAVSALASLTVTYFAYARSGAVGVWSALVAYGVLRARPILYGMMIATVLGLSFIFLFPHTELSELFFSTVHPTTASGVRYGSNLARIHMLENTETILHRHPLTGAGFNCYGMWTKKNRPEDAGWQRTFSDPVEFLATTGITGFIGFVMLYLAILYVLFMHKDVFSNAVLAGFMTFAAGGAFEPMFFNTVLLRGMMFLIGLAMLTTVDREAKR